MEPIEPSGPDYRARTRRRLKEIVEDAAGEPPLFAPIEAREVGRSAIAELVVRWRCHPNLAEPDDVELAVMEVLYHRGRTRAERLVSLLADRFSESTVRRRLAGLVRLRVLTSSSTAPRGYDLDPWFRQQGDAA